MSFIILLLVLSIAVGPVATTAGYDLFDLLRSPDHSHPPPALLGAGSGGSAGSENPVRSTAPPFTDHATGLALDLANLSPLPSLPSWTAEGNQANAYLGQSVAPAGDVNGDGCDDALVGAPYFDHDELDEGAVLAFYGSPSGLGPLPGWTVEGDQSLAYLGCSVGPAGDVNGDGYDDVLAGAYDYDNGQVSEGRFYLFHGSPTGLSSTPDWTFEGDQAYANLGWSASTAGDVNGDDYDNPLPREGRAYLFFGSEAGLGPGANWTAESGQAESCFSIAVSAAGDVNGDGCDDVVVGTYKCDNGETDEGRALAYYGTAADLALDKTDRPDPLEGAGLLTYTLTLTNTGPHVVVMTASNPCGWNVVSHTVPVSGPEPPPYRIFLPRVDHFPLRRARHTASASYSK